MKNLVVALCVAAFTVIAHVIVLDHNENRILSIRAEILEDQLADYANQLSEKMSNKTYEEGLKDGYDNAHNLKYVEGYHQATKDRNAFSTFLLTEEMNVSLQNPE